MRLPQILPYLRYTIRNARNANDLRAICDLLGYGGIDFNRRFTDASFARAKRELLEEFDNLVAHQKVIYTGNYETL